VWSDPGADEGPDSHLHAGRFLVDLTSKKTALAVAAPGLR
jgi:hypothetical protein